MEKLVFVAKQAYLVLKHSTKPKIKTPNQPAKQKRLNSCQVDHKYNGEILLFRN